MEEEEKAEEAAGARITVRKKGKGKGGRQTKLTGGSDTGNSLKETRPSPFAETVNPVIPEFCAEKKKPSRGRVKAEPKSTDDDETSKDPKQQKLSVEVSEVKAKKKAPADKTKKKVKVVSGSESGEEEEEEVENKSLRERIELRKTKATSYKEDCVSDESEVSEGSWKSGSGGDFEFSTPPIKKAKMVTTGGGKSAPGPSDAAQTDPKPVGGDIKVKTGPKTVKLTKPLTKPATKKASGSSGSSGEKKKKAVLGKKSRVQDWFSDDSTVNISDSDSDSSAPPAKKVATTEVTCTVHCVYESQYLYCMTSFKTSSLILCALYRRPSHGHSVERGCNTTSSLMTQTIVISWPNN